MLEFLYSMLRSQNLSASEICTTLKVETFAGRNFRDFGSSSVVRESLYPQNRT